MHIETSKGFRLREDPLLPTDGDDKTASARQIDWRCLALGVTFVILIAAYKTNNEIMRLY